MGWDFLTQQSSQAFIPPFLPLSYCPYQHTGEADSFPVVPRHHLQNPFQMYYIFYTNIPSSNQTIIELSIRPSHMAAVSKVLHGL